MSRITPDNPLEYQTPRNAGRIDSWDDIAYVLPMGIFLALTYVGGTWPSLYAASYVAKTILAAAALIVFRHRYTRIRWNFWWLGIILGIVGVVQWVGMEHLLNHFFPRLWEPKVEAYNPFQHFASPGARWAFIGLRWADAALVVPFMEELFWRDYLWRSISAPSNFKLAEVGEADWAALLLVTLVFCSVHIQWLAAIVWGLMIGLLLITTRSLGACIIMHAVTNFLLGAWVLKSGEWKLW